MKSKDRKTNTAEVNRSTLSAPNSYSIKHAVALDFRQLLQYHLWPVSLSICNGDGTTRRLNKIKLKEVLIIGVGSSDKSVLASFPEVFLVDLIALINTMVFELSLTYEEFAQKLMQRIPKNYKRVDLLADDYKSKANSFNFNEQAMRGQSERIQIALLQPRIPPEVRTRILRNNEYKVRFNWFKCIFFFSSLNMSFMFA